MPRARILHVTRFLCTIFAIGHLSLNQALGGNDDDWPQPRKRYGSYLKCIFRLFLFFNPGCHVNALLLLCVSSSRLNLNPGWSSSCKHSHVYIIDEFQPVKLRKEVRSAWPGACNMVIREPQVLYDSLIYVHAWCYVWDRFTFHSRTRYV